MHDYRGRLPRVGNYNPAMTAHHNLDINFRKNRTAKFQCQSWAASASSYNLGCLHHAGQTTDKAPYKYVVRGQVAAEAALQYLLLHSTRVFMYEGQPDFFVFQNP